MHLPLSYRLVVISDSLRGIGGALRGLFVEWVALLAAAGMMTLGVSAAVRRVPQLLVAIRRWFFSPAGTVPLVIVLMGAHLLAAQQVRPSELEANPLVSFVVSVRDALDPVLTGRADDREDFLPRAEPAPDTETPLKTSPIGRGRSPNVVMIVMESVGAKWLQLYGAPYSNTAEIGQLARAGATFGRVYASSPNTSSAMAALFCSVYPLMALRAITRVHPNLQVPGLPALLARHGYRTAFVHGGSLEYDREREFLERHGFAEVVDQPPDAATRIASEAPTLDPAVDWLHRHYGRAEGAREPDRSHPFFLTLWTVQTHFTYYFDDRSSSGGTAGGPFQRYLNGINAADRMVGELRRAIDRLGLVDDTLFIVTGDHGETFGLHGRRAHGFEIYNEEMWIPLVVAGPGVPVQTVGTPVRQIDLAPTILGLLGHAAPAEWQGVDLTKRQPPPRSYLFTGWREFIFGVIENERKAIFHYPEGAHELYDLRFDPDEQRNLASTAAGARELADAREHIEAWIGFQNLYLAGFKGD
jgi:arylsulfatase A-like enzyme